MFTKLQDIMGMEQGDGAASSALGKGGMLLLHLSKLLFVVYSMVHGISASLTYAGNSDWQVVTQVGGIIALEITLVGLYLAFLNHKIKGGAHLLVAGATYGIGFILAALGIIVDSQLNANLAVSPFLLAYLHWGLPLAPMVMALGGFGVHMSDPETLRQRRESDQQQETIQQRFDARIWEQKAALDEQKLTKAVQVFSRKQVLEQYSQFLDSAEFAQAIKRTAAANIPALLSQAGIHFDLQSALPMGAPSAHPDIESIEIDEPFPDGDVPNAIVGGAASRLSGHSQRPDLVIGLMKKLMGEENTKRVLDELLPTSGDPSHRERREEVAAANERLHEIPVSESDGNGVIYRPMRGVPPLK